MNDRYRYLFKTKRVDDGEWIVGGLVRYGFTGKEKYYIVPDYASDLYVIEIDPNTICQCTGLRDKNGNLIWENDIVKGHRISFGSHRHIGKVKYINGRYEIIGVKQYAGFSDALSLSYEVLGNIFDNPELLESEEN